MYFCPECNYSLDIAKSSGIGEDNRKELEKPSDAIKRLNKDLTKYKPLFNKESLLSDKKYKKLSDSDKEKVEKIFSSDFSGGQFKCNNCNYVRNITETIILYKMDKGNDRTDLLTTVDDNKMKAMDPALPRTKDYTCKNVECPSHKDSKLKEAVYYRENNSYKLHYLCTVCNFNWKI